MMKIKSAKMRDFTDVNVRRVFGYAFDVLRTRQDEETIQGLAEAQQYLRNSNYHISLQELQTTPLGEQLQRILGSDNWVSNPHRGIK